jgi:hypothetical protein
MVAVPWGAVSYSAEGKALTVTARVTRAALKGVSFAEGRYPDFTSETWVRGARAAWGERALPGQSTGTQPGGKPPDRKTEDKRPPGQRPPKEKEKGKEKPARPGEKP